MQFIFIGGFAPKPPKFSLGIVLLQSPICAIEENNDYEKPTQKPKVAGRQKTKHFPRCL